jgi:SAM-dependent methyltransferase
VESEHYTKSFYEERRSGVASSAEAIVPLVLKVLPARSVVDVGCGEGGWLAVFRRMGVDDVLGIDGDHVERSRLQIPQEQFQAADLTKGFRMDRIFDLAVSLEVAEHLPENCARGFVESLTRLSPAVLFSAAIPFQRGVHHINEQWPDTWAGLFKERDYVPVDLVRKRVWKNENVDWWYAQNMILFVHPRLLSTNAALRTEFEQTHPGQLSLVHPRKYLDVATPLPAPSWGVRGASQLLMASLKKAIRKRVHSIIGKEAAEPKNRSSRDSS